MRREFESKDQEIAYLKKSNRILKRKLGSAEKDVRELKRNVKVNPAELKHEALKEGFVQAEQQFKGRIEALEKEVQYFADALGESQSQMWMWSQMYHDLKNGNEE